jgi:hypothetical protein
MPHVNSIGAIASEKGRTVDKQADIKLEIEEAIQMVTLVPILKPSSYCQVIKLIAMVTDPNALPTHATAMLTFANGMDILFTTTVRSGITTLTAGTSLAAVRAQYNPTNHLAAGGPWHIPNDDHIVTSLAVLNG